MSVNQLLANFPTNTNFTVPTSNLGPVTFSVGGPAGGGAPSIRITQQIWVAPWGSDTTGDGTEDNPFATILHAQTVALVDASPTKVYQLILYPGIYLENYAVEAFINLVGQIPSNNFTGFYPAQLNGATTLGTTFGGAPSGQFAEITNVDVGAVTLNYVAQVSPTGLVSFTNCQVESDVVLTQNSSNVTEFHNVNFYQNFTQTGGRVEWFNCTGVESGGDTPNTLLVQPAVGISAFFRAQGGSWPGWVTATQNGLDGVQCVINTEGCSMSRGDCEIIATATTSPAIVSNPGDLPANVGLTGAAAIMSNEMRISLEFTNITGAVGATGVTTFDFAVPTAVIGATSIESLQCSFTPKGSNWGSIIGPHAALYAFRVSTAAGVPTIHLDILNTGAGFNITDAIAFNFSAYLPTVI